MKCMYWFNCKIVFGSHRKKITHMWRRWGTPQNFFSAFIDELEKQIITKKTVEVANKKQNNFNIYNVAFFKKI